MKLDTHAVSQSQTLTNFLCESLTSWNWNQMHTSLWKDRSDERRKNQIFPWETWEEDRTVKRRRGWRKREIEVKFYHIVKVEGWLAYSIHHAANVTKLGRVSCALTVIEVIIKTHRPWTQPIYTRAPAIITWSLAWLRGWTYTTGTTVSSSQGINCLGSM